MKKYSTQAINNLILRELSEGRSMTDVLDLFLSRKMYNDMDDDRPYNLNAPSAEDINLNLIGNEVIDQQDFCIKMIKGRNGTIPRLEVKLSSACTLYIEKWREFIHVSVNDKNLSSISLKKQSAGDIALWIIRQKQNLNSYIAEWEDALKKASKKAKGNNMSQLAIKAIFSNAMKECDDVKYEFIEQKRRVRIKVYLPNSRLGVYIDAWLGSYQKTLTEQINYLKILIDAHRRNTSDNNSKLKTNIIQNFFVTKR